MENFRMKLNLNRIIVAKILTCFQTKWCRKRRKTFKTEKFVVLAEYFEQQTDCSRYRRKISKSRKSPSCKGIGRIYISLSSKWKPCHGAINSRTRNFKNNARFPWNCSQLRAEVRSGMPNCEIYFSIFSETIHIKLKIFSQHNFRKCR